LNAKRREINRITAVMKEHDEQLSSYPNVVGFGVGYKVKGGKKLDQLAIIVLVKKKLPFSALKRHEIIPATIRGTLTDVYESGEIFAYPARTDKWRPAPPGVSIGHYLITAGTFGCVALKSGIRKILSNNHVLANSNSAFVGDAIYQPGVHDGGGPADTIALLEDWVPIVFSPVANNVVDAAIAAPINDDDILNEILDIGIPTNVVEAELDMSVVKSGRTTAVTYGTITAINATITVNYGPPGYARFIDQIILTYMLTGGDSGSLLLTHPEHEAVGLIFAGSPTLGVASRIQYAESLLGISIFTGAIDASIDLYAKFVVGQDSADLLGKAVVKNVGSTELLGKFEAQVTTELLSKAVIRRVDAHELLARAEVGQDSIELLGKCSVRHIGTPMELLGKVDITHSVEFLGKFIARQETTDDLLSRTIIRNEATADLFGKFTAQTSVDLLAKILIRHEATVGLLGKADIQQIDAFVELLGKAVIRHTGIPTDLLAKANITHSVALLGKGIIRNIGSAGLPGSLAVGYTGVPAELLAKMNIVHFVGLLGKVVIRQPDSTQLLGRVVIRHVGIPVELLAKIGVCHFEDLLVQFEVGQDSSGLLGGVDIQHSVFSDRLTKLWIRHPYRLWTNRHYLNGVVELDEENLSDAFLEYVIQGVMDDIKSRLINEDMLIYNSWMDITETPKLIRRATTYGTVASLYSRDVNNPQRRIIMGLRPMKIRAAQERAAQERAMDHWETRMEKMMTLYLTAGGRRLMIVDTEDEEPVFSMDDIPFYTEDPYKIKTR